MDSSVCGAFMMREFRRELSSMLEDHQRVVRTLMEQQSAFVCAKLEAAMSLERESLTASMHDRKASICPDANVVNSIVLECNSDHESVSEVNFPEDAPPKLHTVPGDEGAPEMTSNTDERSSTSSFVA